MRVLHLDSGRERRGGQLQVVRLIEGLMAEGVECRLLARAGSWLFGEATRRGWAVRELSLWHIATESRRADLLHAHDARSHTLTALASAAPVVVARRVAFTIQSPWKYKHAEHYIAISEFVRRVLLEGGVEPARITVVGDGVPLCEQSDWSGGVIAPDNAADPGKGAAVAFAASELGGFGLRFSHDLDSDLQHARVFVYLTHNEGLGSAVLRAMASGVPVVASDVGGLPEIVRHRETGMLVENRPQAVAGAVKTLLADGGLSRSLARAARLLVEKRFTSAAMTAGTMEVYRKVLK